MKTPSTRIVAASMASLLLLAACGSSSASSTWTIAPVQPTPTGGPASPAASASPSGMPMPSMTASGAPASPAASAGASGAPASGGPASPAASAGASTAVQTVTLDVTGSLSITDEDGTAVSNLDVKVGETVHFVVDNTAGFAHTFFIGTPDQLAQNQVGDLPGIPEWTSGIQEFDYVVTADTASLQFGCTVPGHYPLMHGTFTVAP
jgi:uncharacterized cupredoxin-like copper-binding protein